MQLVRGNTGPVLSCTADGRCISCDSWFYIVFLLRIYSAYLYLYSIHVLIQYTNVQPHPLLHISSFPKPCLLYCILMASTTMGLVGSLVATSIVQFTTKSSVVKVVQLTEVLEVDNSKSEADPVGKCFIRQSNMIYCHKKELTPQCQTSWSTQPPVHQECS